MTTAASEPTERTCVAGERCRLYDRQRKQAAILDDPRTPLCPDCLMARERDVRALPSDYAAVEQLLPPSLGEWSDGQPRRGRGEQPLPLREHVMVLQRHIWWVLTAWEPVLRELDRLSDQVTVGVREGWAVQRAADVIAPRLAKLARLGPQDMADYPGVDDEQAAELVWGPSSRSAIDHSAPSGVDGIEHMSRLHHTASAMIGLTKRVRRLPGTCHSCLAEGTLRQKEPAQRGDDPPVWCDDCGGWRPYDEYERLMRLVVWQGAA